AFDWKQHPAEIVQFERCEVVRGGSHRRLDFPRVLVKDGLATGNDFCNDTESVAGGSLRKDGTVLALFKLVGLPGYCHSLGPDLHIVLLFLVAMDHDLCRVLAELSSGVNRRF